MDRVWNKNAQPLRELDTRMEESSGVGEREWAEGVELDNGFGAGNGVDSRLDNAERVVGVDVGVDATGLNTTDKTAGRVIGVDIGVHINGLNTAHETAGRLVGVDVGVGATGLNTNDITAGRLAGVDSGPSVNLAGGVVDDGKSESRTEGSQQYTPPSLTKTDGRSVVKHKDMGFHTNVDLDGNWGLTFAGDHELPTKEMPTLEGNVGGRAIQRRSLRSVDFGFEIDVTATGGKAKNMLSGDVIDGRDESAQEKDIKTNLIAKTPPTPTRTDIILNVSEPAFEEFDVSLTKN